MNNNSIIEKAYLSICESSLRRMCKLTPLNPFDDGQWIEMSDYELSKIKYSYFIDVDGELFLSDYGDGNTLPSRIFVTVSERANIAIYDEDVDNLLGCFMPTLNQLVRLVCPREESVSVDFMNICSMRDFRKRWIDEGFAEDVISGMSRQRHIVGQRSGRFAALSNPSSIGNKAYEYTLDFSGGHGTTSGIKNMHNIITDKAVLISYQPLSDWHGSPSNSIPKTAYFATPKDIIRDLSRAGIRTVSSAVLLAAIDNIKNGLAYKK